MLEPVLGNPWVRAVGALLAMLLLCLLAYLLSPVLIPLFMAFLVAYLLDPVVDFFQNEDGKNRFFKWRIPRGVTISALALLGVVLAICLPIVVTTSLISQAEALIAAAHAPREESADTKQQAWLERALESSELDEFLVDIGWKEAGSDVPASAVMASKIGEYVKANAIQFLKNNASYFASAGQWAGSTVAQILASIGRTLMGMLLFLANFALFAFVAGYLLKDYDGLVAAGKALIPPRYRDKTCDILGKIDVQLRSFIRGQLTVCLCLGTMYAVGLLICGVPFALPIAMFGMVASFVPYLGVALTIGPSILLTLLQYRAIDWHLIGVLLTFATAQGLEGNVLTPRIVGSQVGLHPVWVILAILVFGSALGFLGLLLAVPMAASLKVLVVEAVEYYKKSPVFEGG